MTKRQLIDEIVCINHTARPAFLAQFDDGDLNAYLQHLRVMQVPRIQRAPSRYDKYFVSRGASAPAAVPSYSEGADDGEDLDTGGDVQLACESDSPGGTDHVDADAEKPQPAVVRTATQDAELWLY